ncbi:MAG TPA: phosphoglycerate dehydrogenase [Xanthobacteraceae bacterium]|nr:phosphoglycerate dehydrogenase [Xanthobacteraceae bacterium]
MTPSPVRVAVTSRSFSRHPKLRAELLARYADVTFNDKGLLLSGDALIEFLRGHERAITALEKLDESVFAALPELRVIGKFGVGLDSIDLDAMTRHGRKLGWRGGVNRRSVAELVVAFAIACLRLIPQANSSLRGGKWLQFAGRQLTGRTVGIVGCGHVGKDLATLLRAFDCELLAHDIRDFPDFYAQWRVRSVGLERLLAESEIVTLHVPLDATTANMISAARLALMRREAVLINAARGGIVDEAALVVALKEGRLAAAAFDVFSTEPPQNDELLTLPNFLATPHIGGSSEEAIIAMGMAAIEGLETAGDPWTVAAG